MPQTQQNLTEWLIALKDAQPTVRKLLEEAPESQQEQGYFHTLREICQQPLTWKNTADLLVDNAERLKSALHGIQSIVLTGSGSSEYVGDCVRLTLQNELGVPCYVVGGGALVEHGLRAVPPLRPSLIISLARSGDSPESYGALSLLLRSEPTMQHLVLTCNAKGKLALAASPRVTVLVLDDATNDRSLVMTSSFTNLVLAASSLAYLSKPGMFRNVCSTLSDVASKILLQDVNQIANIAQAPFRRAVFLADSTRFGAAREGALKILEASSGRVATMSETYLSFRHGPMSFAHKDALVVCFLSSEPSLRGFECDLLREMQQKQLGMAKLIVGENIPAAVLGPDDVAIECPGLKEVGDENASVIDVLVSQLLAFFRSLHEGLQPDAPSDGVINRVVQDFQIHLPGARQ